MKIALDIGHMGKVSSPFDRGAAYKGVRESDKCLEYALVAFQELEAKGHSVYILCYNDYGNRILFLKKAQIEVHIQCHLNAANGNYSLVYSREDNPFSTTTLGKILSNSFKEKLPVSKSEYRIIDDNTRGYDCIANFIPSFLIEPLFLDNEKHYEQLTKNNICYTIGLAISNSITNWIEGGKK